MRRILIETDNPSLHRGYMVVGEGNSPGSTKLRLECRTINHPTNADIRREEILKRDGGVSSIEISEVR